MPKTPTCPICKKPETQAFRPFCSKRCADIDLGRWISGDYAVPGDPLPTDDKEGDADEDPSSKQYLNQ